MNQLQSYVEDISARHHEHNEKLREAQGRTDEILGTLESIASSATSYESSIASPFGFPGLWPYIICPIGSLVLGSYGLQPSAQRNILLIASGEFFGFVLSRITRHGSTLHSVSAAPEVDIKRMEHTNVSSPKLWDNAQAVISVGEARQVSHSYTI